jgi:hypothetical protein
VNQIISPPPHKPSAASRLFSSSSNSDSRTADREEAAGLFLVEKQEDAERALGEFPRPTSAAITSPADGLLSSDTDMEWEPEDDKE